MVIVVIVGSTTGRGGTVGCRGRAGTDRSIDRSIGKTIGRNVGKSTDRSTGMSTGAIAGAGARVAGVGDPVV